MATFAEAPTTRTTSSGATRTSDPRPDDGAGSTPEPASRVGWELVDHGSKDDHHQSARYNRPAPRRTGCIRLLNVEPFSSVVSWQSRFYDISDEPLRMHPGVGPLDLDLDFRLSKTVCCIFSLRLDTEHGGWS